MDTNTRIRVAVLGYLEASDEPSLDGALESVSIELERDLTTNEEAAVIEYYALNV